MSAAAAELNKFKRRVIRAVARMMRQGVQEEGAEDKMWQALQKEVGCDCKLLWERMRTLTLKKLKRLLPAEDRLDAIATVAQMNLTDWLLFDLVLVHEDIDVISEKAGSQCLNDLVKLVQSFEIEGKHGDDLINAWTALTFHYNSVGRQCSPMLLQRRWFQLKKVTRSKFYSFWFQYRGNSKLLNEAKVHMPNDLHSYIAKTYPYVVTKSFKEWDDLIRERMVILPEEFEAKIKKGNVAKKSNKNEPDLVLVEPHIETIDLRLESDSDGGQDPEDTEKAPENSNDATPAPPVNIKKEIIDEIEIDDRPDLDELIDKEAELVDTNTVVETTEDNVSNDEEDVTEITGDAPEDQNEDEVNNENSGVARATEAATDRVEAINDDEDEVCAVEEISEVEEIDSTKETDTMPKICNVAGSFHEETVMPQITNVYGNVTTDVEESPVETPEDPVIPVLDNVVCKPEPERMEVDDDVEEPNVDDTDITEDSPEEESNVADNVLDPDETHPDAAKTHKDTYQSHTEYVDELIQSVLSKVPNLPVASTSREESKETSVNNTYLDIPTDTNFVDDGIEFVDDGIELDEDDEDEEPTTQIKLEVKEECNDGTPKFDLKLLMQPIVYTTRLDSMTVFKDRDLDSINDKAILDRALSESKPVNKKQSLVEANTSTEDKIEIKMEPEANICIEDNVEIKKEPDIELPDSEVQTDQSESEDESIPLENRIKQTSALLNKPRSRSYNPIQLCKNPDFNTRLKRLTVGFLSSMRNRSLLRMLKPMTIDVSKTFEGKLVNGTMYLQPWDSQTVKREPVVEDVSEQATAVIPSAMPAQSLINNTQLNLGDILPATPIERAHKLQDMIMMDRQRTFNLPNISDVRRMNQKLLVAEVTPIMRINSDPKKCTPPVQLCMQSNKGPLDIQKNKEETSKPDLNFSHTPKDDQKALIAARSVEMSGAAAALRNDVFQHIQNSNSKQVSEATTPRLNDNQPLTTSSKEVESGPSSAKLGKNADKTNTTDKRPKYTYVSGYRVMPEKIHLPWNKPKAGPNVDESLLTLDTLNKMLNIVNSKNEVEIPYSSKTLKKSLEKKRLELVKRMDEFEKKIETSDKKEETSDITIVDENNAKDVPTKNNKSDSEVISTKVKNPTAKKGRPRSRAPKVKVKIKYWNVNTVPQSCCWARYKLLEPRKASFLKHQCRRSCKCCCKVDLAKSVINGQTSAKRQWSISISDDEEMNETIDSVVNNEQNKITRSIQCDMPATPVQANVKLDAALKSIMQNESPKASPISKRGKPCVYISHTNTTTPKSTSETIVLDDAENIIKGQGATTSRPMFTRRAPLITTARQLTPITPNTALKINTVSTPNIAPKPHGHIIIDATNNLTTINSQTYENHANKLKEKILYMKNATRKEDGPIYLGKNKILLTNIKFPRVMPAPDPQVNAVSVQEPKDMPSVLPPGVQLVLLPTGQVTYVSETGVNLDAEQMRALPAILEAVQKQLNTGSVPAAGSIPYTSEGIVNLIDENKSPDKNIMESANLANVTQKGPTSVTNDMHKAIAQLGQLHNNEAASVNVDDNSANRIMSLDKRDSENAQVDKNGLDVETQNNQLAVENINEPQDMNAQSPNKNAVSSVLNEGITNVDRENKNDDETTDNEPPQVNTEKPANNIVETTSEVGGDTDKAHETAVTLDPEEDSVAEKQMESENATVSTTRKSLLSDLMAMSGIWDDIQSESPITNETASDVLPGVLPMEVMPGVSPLAVVPGVSPMAVVPGVSPMAIVPGILPGVVPLVETAPLVPMPGVSTGIIHPEVIPTSSLAPLAPNSPIKSIFASGTQMPELTPITSFTQLKYACEQDGQFFKLDLERGTISSISVSIKSKLRQVQPINAMPKSVIDLTEDEDSVRAVEIREEPEAPSMLVRNRAAGNRSLLKSAHPENTPATPLKLFRSVRILKRKGDKNWGKTILLPAKTRSTVNLLLDRKRKQQIVMRESPPSVEPEYLEPEYLDEESLDSGYLDKYIWGNKELHVLSSDDSSDDEPLAAKAKRMRVDEVGEAAVADEGKGVDLVEDATDAPLDDQTQSNEHLQPNPVDVGAESVDIVGKQSAEKAQPLLASLLATGLQLAADQQPKAVQLPLSNHVQPQMADEPQLIDDEESQLPGDDESQSALEYEQGSPIMPYMADDGGESDEDGDCILGF